MNRAQIIGIAAGVTVGLLGVGVGVALARKEGRDAARRWLEQSSDLRERSAKAARSLAEQAKRAGAQVADQARKQYEVQAPRVQERINGLIAQAPQAADALNAAISRTGLNGRAALAPANKTNND
jgi:flagellar biosynthesis/type III secretory pathway protein FliH